MGTTIFETDLNTRDLLASELGLPILGYSVTPEGACVLCRVPVGPEDDFLRAMYDVDLTQSIVMAFIIKGHGISGTGRRSVSTKIMDETMGPYDTFGATHPMLDRLTPLRADADIPAGFGHAKEYIANWRARARDAAGPRRFPTVPVTDAANRTWAGTADYL
jgi:hypothetical protein